MHGPHRRGEGSRPGPLSQRPEVPISHGRQTLRIATARPTAAGGEEILLIHRLIGTTPLEALGPISREQQQRCHAVISLHHRRQQVGHSAARGGDHRRGNPIGAAKAERQEGGGALIHTREQLQTMGLQQPRRNRQRRRAAAGAKHEPPKPAGLQGLQKVQGGTQVGGGAAAGG